MGHVVSHDHRSARRLRTQRSANRSTTSEIPALNETLDPDARQDELVQNLTHELRAPLATIQAVLEILADSPDLGQHDAQHLTRQLSRSVAWMSEMIDDLTVWSVLQDDRLVLHSAQVQVKDWIDSTVLLVQPILDRKQQDIQIVCPESGVEVAGDARYLTHILLNLLVNAARYSKNHDQIIIRVVAAEQNVRITVIDQGPGVAKEDQKRIFQRYERGKRARTSDPGGLGLGLYIVNRLITLHGGSFGLDSEVGKGATFWFTLPQATIATTDHEDLAISTRESETHREDFTC